MKLMNSLQVIEHEKNVATAEKRMEHMKMLKMMNDCDASWKTASTKQKERNKKHQTTIAGSSDREAERSQPEPGS